MDISSFVIFSSIELLAFIVGIFFIVYGSNSKTKQNDKHLLPLIIAGRTLVALSVIGFIFCFVLYVSKASGEFGTYLLIFISPLFILAGFLICVSIGSNLLASAYRKPKEDVTRKQSIVRGWFLLVLAIVIVILIIVTFMVLLKNYGGAREHPIRMM